MRRPPGWWGRSALATACMGLGSVAGLAVARYLIERLP